MDMATAWRKWVERPEQLRPRQFIFQTHLWIGAIAGGWMLVMSLSGSVLVFRDQLASMPGLDTLLFLHTSLLMGPAGRVINAIGALALIALCATGAVIWWPGRAHWRRSLKIEWRANFPRISWDTHSALGFWLLLFVLMWGVSGLYLSRPQFFDLLYRLDPQDRVTDPVLFALTTLHFGRYNLAAQMIWALVGLVPAVLAFTGVFICCRRVMFHKPSSPKQASH
jgi:uncharacterized iron-regulated membrane protein